MTAQGNAIIVQMNNSRWVEDLAVSGVIHWVQVKPGAIRAEATFDSPGGAGRLTISWNDREPQAKATISGIIGNRQIAARMEAP